MFDGFETRKLETERGAIHARVGRSGPPLLLLHGYPETHLMWHATAPLLAQRFTVVGPGRARPRCRGLALPRRGSPRGGGAGAHRVLRSRALVNSAAISGSM